MKQLIINIETFLKNDVSSGYININGIKKSNIKRGLINDPTQLQFPEFPYIVLGDGGESTEEADSENTLWRTYSVVFQFATYQSNVQDALDDCLDFSDQIEASVKAERNRQSAAGTSDGYDDMTWGVNITPYEWEEDRYFYKGRQVIVDYKKLEFTEYDRF